MRTMTSRAIATAAAALIALTTMSLQPAAASWRDDAAALTVFGAVLGTVAAVIAAEHDRDGPAYAPAYRYDGDHRAYAHGREHRDPHEHGWRHDER